jgi:hypothetical protein
VHEDIHDGGAVNGATDSNPPLITCADSITQHGHVLQYPGLPCIGVLVPAWKKRHPQDCSKWYRTVPLECCWWVSTFLVLLWIAT